MRELSPRAPRTGGRRGARSAPALRGLPSAACSARSTCHRLSQLPHLSRRGPRLERGSGSLARGPARHARAHHARWAVRHLPRAAHVDRERGPVRRVSRERGHRDRSAAHRDAHGLRELPRSARAASDRSRVRELSSERAPHFDGPSRCASRLPELPRRTRRTSERGRGLLELSSRGARAGPDAIRTASRLSLVPRAPCAAARAHRGRVHRMPPERVRELHCTSARRAGGARVRELSRAARVRSGRTRDHALRVMPHERGRGARLAPRHVHELPRAARSADGLGGRVRELPSRRAPRDLGSLGLPHLPRAAPAGERGGAEMRKLPRPGASIARELAAHEPARGSLQRMPYRARRSADDLVHELSRARGRAIAHRWPCALHRLPCAASSAAAVVVVALHRLPRAASERRLARGGHTRRLRVLPSHAGTAAPALHELPRRGRARARPPHPRSDRLRELPCRARSSRRHRPRAMPHLP